MSNVKLVFLPEDTGGPGKFEMFVDLDSSGGASIVMIEPPPGWTTRGIKMYPTEFNPGNGKVMQNSTKQSDKGQLSGGNLGKYQTVFNGAALPPGFFFASGDTGTLVTTKQTLGEFEFLVWIQDGGGSNDYLDPGLKNRD